MLFVTPNTIITAAIIPMRIRIGIFKIFSPSYLVSF